MSSFNSRRRYHRTPSLQPVTRALLKAIAQHNCCIAPYTTPLRKPSSSKHQISQYSRRSSYSTTRSIRSSKSSISKKGSKRKKGKQNNLDPITVLFRYLDQHKTGLLTSKNIRRTLNSTCERMLEPLVNGILNRDQQYDLPAFRKAVLEMFPYWQQSCLYKLVVEGRHKGRPCQPGTILDRQKLKQLEAILNGTNIR